MQSPPLSSLEAAVAEAGAPVARVRALDALATELARTGQAKRALILAEEARSIAEGLQDSELLARALHTLGRCHFYVTDFVMALELLLEATRMYRSRGDAAGAATTLAGVGLCQHRLNAQEDAVASLLSAGESARELGLAALEINIYNSLASVELTAGRPGEAERYLVKGIELATAQDNKNLLTKLVHNQTLVAQKRGEQAADRDAALREYSAGLALSQQALSLARELGNRYDEAHSLGQSGTMYRLLGKAEEAFASLSAALALGRDLDETRVQAEALLELGRLHIGRDGAEARRYFNEAIALAGLTDARHLLADACSELSAQFEREGDLKASLAAYKRYHAEREAEFTTTREHAARAAHLWLDFQHAARQATQYREQAALLAEDKQVLAKQAEALTEASEHDPLTSLLNRRGLDARVGVLIAASDRNDVPLTVALIDIDNFKTINDSFSHMVGDMVLKRVAAIIGEHCRANDLPVRYGGDEFLLVLAGADRDGSARVLRRLKDAVDACRWSSDADGGALLVTLSIGAATRVPGASIATTIADADQALYTAKSGGRNRIVYWPATRS
jgi:diguanylate cyclase (GGDEF)-like protein